MLVSIVSAVVQTMKITQEISGSTDAAELKNLALPLLLPLPTLSLPTLGLSQASITEYNGLATIVLLWQHPHSEIGVFC